MDETKVKEIFQNELKALKESLGHFVKPEDMQKEISDLKEKIEAQNIEGLSKQIEELEKAAKEQGELLTQMKEKGNDRKVKTLKELLFENKDAVDKLVNAEDSSAGKINVKTTVKAVMEGSVVDDTMAYRDGVMGKIQRGNEWIRNLFNVVNLGSNTHGSVKWYEQQTITDNGEMVAEGTTPTSPSEQTWVEKTLSGKRIKAYTKISKDQLKDVDFVASEVRETILKSLRLQENEQLYVGDGTGNNIEGIYTKAPTFDTTGISIPNANMFDLINKARTQVRVAGKDGFFPNYVALHPNDVDTIRLAKNTDGDYLFPTWAMSGVDRIASLGLVENSLVTENTLLLGDFSRGTVYVWDGLGIEIGYVGSDFTDGMVTIVVYERLNLRVKDVDANAFIKSTDIAADVTSITSA